MPSLYLRYSPRGKKKPIIKEHKKRPGPVKEALMARHRDGYVRPLHDVFKMINMHAGDTSVCWEWLGTIAPRPIFCWNNTRLQARRVVYALRNGLHYENCPPVTSTCRNPACCNPTHLIPEHGLIDKLIRHGGLDDKTLSYVRGANAV